MSSEIKGIDISQHQGSVDWGKIEAAYKSGEIGFVSVRAGYGGGGRDKQFERNWNELRARGIPRNAYFFMYPGRSVGVVQASEFYNIVGPLQAGESIMLDFEGDPTYGRNLNQSDVDWSVDFLNKAHDLFGVKPLIYMNSNDNNRLNWDRVVALDVGLWIANYGPNNGQPNTRPGSGKWPFWAIWQYTSKGNVAGIGPVDTNIFSGDQTAFLKYGKGGTVTTPQPTPKPPVTPPQPPKPAPGGTNYTVKSGDNLSKIAGRFNTTWQKIYADNKAVIGPDPDEIRPGQVLKINGGASPAPAPQPTTHRVVSGDTNGKLATKYGTTVDQIVAWNKAKYSSITRNYIQAGWTLRVR